MKRVGLDNSIVHLETLDCSIARATVKVPENQASIFILYSTHVQALVIAFPSLHWRIVQDKVSFHIGERVFV